MTQGQHPFSASRTLYSVFLPQTSHRRPESANHQGFHTEYPPAAHSNGSARCTCSSHKPCAGAVRAAIVRSQASRISPTQFGGRFPSPTSTRQPAMMRTWWRKNASPSTTIATSSATSVTVTDRTTRIGCRAAHPTARNVLKSWRPSRKRAASTIAGTSSGRPTCQTDAARNAHRAVRGSKRYR